MAWKQRPWTPPEHWDDVEKLGDTIPMGIFPDTAAKIVAARVPLDAKYTTKEGEEWTPAHLIAACRERQLVPKMVIDLTNTFKYYDGNAGLESHGVKYVKMKVEGFADVPDQAIVKRFIDALSAWETDLRASPPPSSDESSLTPVVIVHCTHGLNRTGYLIARYLIATRGLSVKDALTTFASARPPGLIKHFYVQTLYDMFEQSEHAVMPTLPAWALNKYDRSKDALLAADKFNDHGKRRRIEEPRKRSPPENWFDPPRMAAAIVADSPFLPMRTLLDDSYDHRDDTWTPEVFLAEQALRGHHVQLVLDLTNTNKYYNGPASFSPDVAYKKFALEGFNAAPRPHDVAAFLTIVDAFEATHPDGHIAIHCTHGLNRTGYLIASYLIARKQYSVQAALDAFGAARPPGLIKYMYIDALHRLHSDASVQVVYPALPPWAEKKYAKRRSPDRRADRRSADRRADRRSADRRDNPPRRLEAPHFWAKTPTYGAWVSLPSTTSPSAKAIHLLPMKAMLDSRYESDGSWTVDALVARMEALATIDKTPLHGLVNLSGKDTFYDAAALPPTLKTLHFNWTTGRVPPQSDVDAFVAAVAEWQAAVGDDDELRVAVHCGTGGVTGYFIAQLLAERAHMSVDDACAAYSAAWPPGYIPKRLQKQLYFVERKKRERGGLAKEPGDDGPMPLTTEQLPKSEQPPLDAVEETKNVDS
ncbi:Aste57867_21921 [Aphanomyces stellatus]|uniref:Aste57867_21921 protein n=1 Tax=Aphanomyces stellatus TaxID=120398 RepID=A0A485LIT6_9STRA|nr:hypothetical protein As57867_021852 [Aphanomyces stellatus]VFT98589.1 Aste57867_21921 [Aphanomyces stellatus]